MATSSTPAGVQNFRRKEKKRKEKKHVCEKERRQREREGFWNSCAMGNGIFRVTHKQNTPIETTTTEIEQFKFHLLV
jgi:hypothetical protein